MAAYRAIGAAYDIEVVLPGGGVRSYRLELGQPTAHFVHRIAASALADWITNAKSFFFVRAWSRREQLAYRLEREGDEVTVDRVMLPDLLMHYVVNVAPGSELVEGYRLRL